VPFRVPFSDQASVDRLKCHRLAPSNSRSK
jgi:hypothetical protein